ncbi:MULTISPECIES: hypothetical protein [Streptomyces]|uniref:hypothetical protein n=1 Tax=Streptomyces TaxID=1883 RepID=UPI0033F8BA61
MTLDRAYADARQLIDPDADYTVHVRAGNGWQPPGNRDQRELPGLDVLLAARRVLCAQPAGRVWSTRPDTLNVCTGDGLLWLRFTVTTLAETGLCDAAECAEFLTDSGHCPRCAADPSPGPGGRAPTAVWKVLGPADSAVPTVTRDDLTTTEPDAPGPRLPHPRPAAPCPPRPHAAAAGGKAAPSAPGTHA